MPWRRVQKHILGVVAKLFGGQALGRDRLRELTVDVCGARSRAYAPPPTPAPRAPLKCRCDAARARRVARGLSGVGWTLAGCLAAAAGLPAIVNSSMFSLLARPSEASELALHWDAKHDIGLAIDQHGSPTATALLAAVELTGAPVSASRRCARKTSCASGRPASVAAARRSACSLPSRGRPMAMRPSRRWMRRASLWRRTGSS